MHVFVFVRVYDCVGCVCMQASVRQKKESHSKSWVVWERGSSLSHSAGGKLLSLSFGGGIICISCHPPFSFFSCRLRSTTEAAGSLSSEEISENSALSCCLPPGTTLSHRYGFYTVETKPSRSPVHVGCDVECCLPVIGRSFWFAYLKIGTHLKGKPKRKRSSKGKTKRNEALRGESWNK